MEKMLDFLIIGAGPAGLQLGYFFEKNSRDYLILERDTVPGAFFKTYPRHGKLISINKVYTGTDHPAMNLRWDWNSLLCDSEDLLFTKYSRRYFPASSDLVRYCKDFADHYQLKIQYETVVESVSKVDGRFRVRLRDGRELQAKCLVAATGLSAPRVPDFPGAELCENYADHDTAPEKYANQRVLIVGKGNSAFETADNLIETAATIHVTSPESVRMAWQSHFVGHLRAVNNDFLDTYQLKSQNAVIDADIVGVERKDDGFLVQLKYTHAMGQTAAVYYDRVILCTGFRMDPSIFDDSCRPEMAVWGKLPAQTLEWESANVPDLFFAGTLMQACDYKKTMSGFIHGFRHNIASLARLLEQRYCGTAWPHETLDANPEAVLRKVIDQVNTSPGIFLQPGFLCDVVIVEDQKARYFSDIRKDYALDHWVREHDHLYTISLEYGHFDADPFSIERDPSPDKGDEAAYLHPVVRHFSAGELVAEHHINDDLESQWYKEIYVEPVRSFLIEQFTRSADSLTAEPGV